MSVRSKPNREGKAPAEPERDGSELPEGWASTTVAAVIENFQSGFASGDKNVEFGVSHLRMNNIGLVGELILDLVRTVPEKLAKPRHDLRPGDVLVCTTNSGKLVGKCSLFDLEGRYAFSNHLTRLRPNREVIDGSFLRWCLWSRWKAGAFDDKCKHWVNQSTIPKDALLEADIPLPPLAEQRRIVGKLELLLGKVSSSQQRLSRVPGLLKRFRQSVLAAACSGKLTADWRDENEDVETATELLERLQTERRKTWLSAHTNRKYQEPDRLEDDDLEAIPESWLWTNFDHCASEITVGHVGPMKDRYVDSGVAFLRSQNVRPLRFDPMGLVRIPKDFQAELTKSRLVGGEILVVRSGANTGDCCVFPRGMEAANCADLVITRPLSGLCAEYGAMYVASPIGQAAIGLRQTGIAQPHFNIGAMRVKPFPLPPLSEQQEIVRRVEKLFAFADQIEARLRPAQAHVNRLTQSLLAKAFRGELVPTEHALATREARPYEPASCLLDRIRAESDSTAPRPANRRRSRQ